MTTPQGPDHTHDSTPRGVDWSTPLDSEPAAAGPSGDRETLLNPAGFAEAIPRPVRLAAAWSLRLAIIGLGIYLLVWLLTLLAVVIVPAVVSLLVAALLAPAVVRLRRWGVPKTISPILVFLAGILLFAGLVTLIVRELVVNVGTIIDTVQAGLKQLTTWLSDGPLQIDTDTLNSAIDDFLNSLRDDPGSVASGAVDVVSTAGGLMAGIILALFGTYFFLTDGRTIWGWTVRLFPLVARSRVNAAGHRAWDVLVAYVRVTLVIAVLCGVLIGGAAAIAGVPLALSIGLVVFLFAFIPTLGALISTIIVILLALVTNGITAAIVLGIVSIVVQTVQGNVLYPMLMNRQLKVHPIASLALVSVGAVLGGIFGALIAVPLAAVINTGWIELARATRVERRAAAEV